MSAPDRLPNDTGPGQLGNPADATLCAVWLAGVALAPVWFGSNEPFVWAAHALLFGLVLTAYGSMMLIRGRPLPVPPARLWLPLLAIAIVEGWGAIQTVSWVPSAWWNPAWPAVSKLLGDDIPGAISVYPAASRTALLWTATAATVFFLAVQWGGSPRRARLILQVLTLAGGAIAAYGLIVYVRGNDWVLWRPKHAYYTVPTATFINRNTFAAYSGVTMVCAFGLCLDGMLKGNSGRAPRTMFRFVWRLGLLGAVFALACAGLLLSGSRAGLAVTAIGIAVVLALTPLKARSSNAALMVFFFLAAATAAVVLLTGVAATARLPILGSDMAGRMDVYERVFAAITASPWLGYGLGTFEQAFPMFRGDTLASHGIWQYAHNDWLEALMALGIPVGLVLWLIFGWILARCVWGSVREDSPYCRIAAAVCVLSTIHSLVDFSMQIQGFALPVLAILGVGVSQSWPKPRDGSPAALHSSPMRVDFR